MLDKGFSVPGIVKTKDKTFRVNLGSFEMVR